MIGRWGLGALAVAVAAPAFPAAAPVFRAAASGFRAAAPGFRAAAPVFRAAAPVFRYDRPVQLAPATARETCVVLPADLLSHAAPWLQDLRVMAGDREVAYQVLSSSEVGAEVARPQQILNLGQRDGAVSFDVAMTEPRYNRVRLRIGRSHFSVLIHVTGSERAGESGVAFPESAFSSNVDQDEPRSR